MLCSFVNLCTALDNRFIVSSGSMWMREFAQTLEREFKPQGMIVCDVERSAHACLHELINAQTYNISLKKFL